MKVQVRLFASLRDRLPGDRRAHRGRGELDLPAAASLQDLLDRLDIEPRLAQMVLVNGDQQPRNAEQRRTVSLAEGDIIAIFPPVAGG